MRGVYIEYGVGHGTEPDGEVTVPGVFATDALL
jgi:hypothetical protein